MDLTRILLRAAAGRPHVMLVGVPGGTAERLTVERELRRRGWPAAASAADADLLVITGPVGPRLQPLVDRLWRQVPAPRVRILLRSADGVASTLDGAWAQLADGGEPPEPAAGEGEAGHAGGHGGHRDTEADGHDEHDGHDGHDGHDEHDEHGGGHGGHHGHGMEMPGGLPMADRGQDRDGLMLDQLHVPLGPLLPDWPAGLVVHTTLQGDVIQEARVEVVRENAPVPAYWTEPWRRALAGEPVPAGEAPRRLAAGHLDSLGRLLMVAGWWDAAVRAQRLRDDLLAGTSAGQLMPGLRRLTRHLRGSRTLRWLTDGLGVLPAATAEDAGVSGPALRASRSGGDVSARWQTWLADVERMLPDIDEADLLPADSEAAIGEVGHPAALLAVLPGLLDGVELAAARLIVASLDPDLAELPSRGPVEVAGD